MLAQCCVCFAIRRKDGNYMYFNRKLRRFFGVGVSHTYCPECFRAAMDEIEKGKHHEEEKNIYVRT